MEEQRARQEDEAKKAMETTATEPAPVQETGKYRLYFNLAIPHVFYAVILHTYGMRKFVRKNPS